MRFFLIIIYKFATKINKNIFNNMKKYAALISMLMVVSSHLQPLASTSQRNVGIKKVTRVIIYNLNVFIG